MLLILACAWGLLRIATWSVFGRLTSSTYWPSPRINLGSSRRLTLAPTNLLTGMAFLRFRVLTWIIHRRNRLSLFSALASFAPLREIVLFLAFCPLASASL